jgi:hypothetical protein
VGNENKRCGAVFVVGALYNLTSLHQAMGRLRPSQRRPNGVIEIFHQPYHGERKDKMKEHSNQIIKTVVQHGLISHNQVDYFRGISTFDGLMEWATLDKGCRLVSMARRFGYVKANACKVCDHCVNTPRISLCVTGKENLKQTTINQNRALHVLHAMEARCLVCKKTSCDGEACLGYGCCYNCGNKKHRRSECTFKYADLTRGRRCDHCLDYFDREGYVQHDYKTCPLKRRLRRLLIEAHRETKNRSDFAGFARRTIGTLDAWCEFLSSNSGRVRNNQVGNNQQAQP